MDSEHIVRKVPDEHRRPSLGRKRAASGMTCLLGALSQSKTNPQPSLIASVLTLESNPGIDALRTMMMQRVTQMPRFRSKLVLRRGHGYWQEVEVDAGYHFEVRGFGKKNTKEDVDRVVEDCKNWAFTHERPLWKVIHIPEMEDGTSTMVFVIHHAIGDGVSLVDALFRIVDNPEDIFGKPEGMVKRRTTKPQVGMMKKIGITMYGVYEGYCFAFFKQDPPSPLKLIGGPSSQKLIAKSESIELAQVKQVKETMGSGISVNDVLMAVFTKTLIRYMVDHAEWSNERVKNLKVRTQFPINLRKKDNKYGDASNQWAFGNFQLPLSEGETAEELIWAIHHKMNIAKLSPAPAVSLASVPVNMALMPTSQILKVASNAANIATLILSNVPGPQVPVYFCKQKITDMSFYLFSGLGIFYGLLSFCGKVTCTINVDAKIGVDPKHLANLWVPCFNEVYNEICGAGAAGGGKSDVPVTEIAAVETIAEQKV